MFGYWLESPAGERRVVVLALSDPARRIADIDAAIGVARPTGLAAEPTGLPQGDAIGWPAWRGRTRSCGSGWTRWTR